MITFNNKAFMLMLFNYDILSIILLENSIRSNYRYSKRRFRAKNFFGKWRR